MLGPVFRAHDPEGEHEVAIKVFRLDLTPERAADLADALSRLCLRLPVHSRIVTCHAAGLTGSLAWLAQQYVGADALDARIRRRTAGGLRQALPLLQQIAEALDVAASAGVHHGALHPRDVLISTTGDSRVTGFGVVEALLTVGAPATVRRPYAAPERVAQGSTAPDAAFDVFSLGAIAVELLTGRRPFGTGAAAAGFVSGVADGVDADRCRKALATALAESPGARFPTAGAFLEALSQALDETAAREAHAARPRTSPRRESASEVEQDPVCQPALPDVAQASDASASTTLGAEPVVTTEAAQTAGPVPATPVDAGIVVSETTDGIGVTPEGIDEATLAVFPSERSWDAATPEPEAVPPAQLEVATEAAPRIDVAEVAIDRAGTGAQVALDLARRGTSLVAASPAARDARPEPATPMTVGPDPTVPTADAPGARAAEEDEDPTMSGRDANVALATLWTAAVFAIGVGLGLSGGYLLWGRSSAPPGSQGVMATEQPIAPSAPQPVEAEEPVLPADTPVNAAAAPTGSTSAGKVSRPSSAPLAPPPARAQAGSRPPSVNARMTAERNAARAARSSERSSVVSARPGRAAIEVVSRPAGARVYIDGHLVGTTPYRAPAIPTGSRSVRLELDGYRAWATTVSLETGGASRVAASLELSPPR